MRKLKPEVPYYHKPHKMTHEEWQKALRLQFGQQQKFKLKNLDGHPIFSDFEVTNPQTKKTYKVAIRSEERGLNFCSCPDFAINTLGTCKHIEFTIHRLKKQKGAKRLFKESAAQSYSSVFLKYGTERKVMLRIGAAKTKELQKLASKYFDSSNVLLPEAFDKFEKFSEAALKFDTHFRCYNDALNFVLEVRDLHKREQLISEKYQKGANNGGLDCLLKTKLYPYQKEGVLFAASAGRCLIADDMGLGKTIQAIGASELMAKEFGVEKVLIICPTSLKYQWESEIKKFIDRSSSVIEGMYLKREQQYHIPSFFKITSYNSIKSDLNFIAQWAPDMVILDEAQRIKNWKTITAQSVKNIFSPYAIILTGTPLENRLEELHSVVQFIDRYKLGPLFKFLENHQMVDENGKVIGYRNLNEISRTLSSILIRRNKKEVLKQLPERIDKTFFVPVTKEQREIHDDYAKIASRLVHKWRRFKFLSEKERQMLLIALNCMRMVSNSTFILDEQTRYDTKIDELMVFLKEVFETKDIKVVIFSQWERMTRLVAENLVKLKIGFQSLHGGVPSHKRKYLLEKFRDDSNTLVFLSTDAGGVGLNLQAASIVVNLDLPWNPAVLEQRIARVHRIGQNKPVNVINFVSSGTIEEQMLHLIKFKKSMFEGVLDGGQNEVFMSESKFTRLMKTVEQIVKPLPEATSKNAEEKGEKTEVKTAGLEPVQELFSTGIAFLEKLSMAASNSSSGKSDLSSFIEEDKESGKACLKIPMPDKEILNKFASAADAFINILKR